MQHPISTFLFAYSLNRIHRKLFTEYYSSPDRRHRLQQSDLSVSIGSTNLVPIRMDSIWIESTDFVDDLQVKRKLGVKQGGFYNLEFPKFEISESPDREMPRFKWKNSKPKFSLLLSNCCKKTFQFCYWNFQFESTYKFKSKLLVCSNFPLYLKFKFWTHISRRSLDDHPVTWSVRSSYWPVVANYSQL